MRARLLRLVSAATLSCLASSAAQGENAADPQEQEQEQEQEATALKKREPVQRAYPFILVHHPARLYTMKQFDQNYLSAYRMLSRELEALSPKHAFTIQLLATLFTLPLSHEEGHRSILTTKRIGSISRPYFDEHGAAYVEGVSDQSLQELRDSDLPSYIRLHAGGLESDYAIGNRCSALSAFGQEKLKTIYIECAMRRINQVFYLASSLVPWTAPKLEEEEDELDRDIVGHDVWGAIRHLHRPDMPFYRYTNYDDLTDEEQDFATRVAIRSFANLAAPSLFGKRNWQLAKGLKIAGGLGYSLAPFGDFLDEQIWLKVGSDLRLHFYARQFQNKHNWFPAAGASLVAFPLHPRLQVDASVHLWRQPKDLAFQSSQGKSGGLVSVLAKYQFLQARNGQRSISLDIGATAKSQGFVPEEPYLKQSLGLQLGTTIHY